MVERIKNSVISKIFKNTSRSNINSDVIQWIFEPGKGDPDTEVIIDKEILSELMRVVKAYDEDFEPAIEPPEEVDLSFMTLKFAERMGRLPSPAIVIAIPAINRDMYVDDYDDAHDVFGEWLIYLADNSVDFDITVST